MHTLNLLGEINLLTIENRIDLQNSVCVTPTGHLILSLVTEDYEALGIEGKPSSFDHKPHTRYGKNYKKNYNSNFIIIILFIYFNGRENLLLIHKRKTWRNERNK